MAKHKLKKPNPKIKVKKIQETEGLNTGFGEYEESTGGGHVFEKGNSNTRTTQENGKTRKAENPSTMQARTSDGKFTYKSVNGQSIDPKYGPSRGKTVPPTLTGGVNGIKIEDVEKEFKGQSGSYWDKYKGKWYQKGGEVVTTGLSTKISAEAVWNMAKEYNKNLGEFKGESENWKSKKGAPGKEEKAAIDVAKTTGEQQNVLKETGEIKTFGQKFKDFVKAKEEPVQPAQEQPTATEEVKEEVVQDKPFGTSGKLFDKHVDGFKAKMKDELGDEYNEEMMTDDVIEEFLLSLSDQELQEIYDYKKK